MTIRYLADMHFDHADIIPYDNRPFDSVQEMNEALIGNWNRVVTDPQDLMTVTENYRTAVERLLSAPYGSVNILKLQELQTVADQIHLHWKK